MYKITLIALTSTILVSCGGGGGGAPSPSTSTNTFGASKGATIGATCALEDENGTVLDSGSTIAPNGEFVTSNSLSAGLLTLTCTGGEYLDEVTGITKTGTTMRATINHTGGDVVAITSPISEAVYARAQALGGDASALETANSDIADALGLESISANLATIKPTNINTTDLTNNSNSDKLALILTAVSQKNKDTAGTGTVSVIDDFVGSLIDGTLNTTTFNIESLITNLPASVTSKISINTRTVTNNLGHTGTPTPTATITAINFSASEYTLAQHTGGFSEAPTLTPSNIRPRRYTATDLPAGLSINQNLGIISGTPTVMGISTATIVAFISPTNSATTTIVFTVNRQVPILADIGTSTVTTGVVNTAITPITFINTGGEVASCTAITTLPAGLNVAPSGNTCQITGTPTEVSASANYTIRGSNITGSDTATVNITINPRAPILANITTATIGVVNSAITPITFTNTGGEVASCTPVTTLPTGLSVAKNGNTCQITGTPSAVTASAHYTIRGTNITGSDTATVNITINSAAPNLADYGSVTLAQNVAMNTIIFTNSGGAVTSCTPVSTLPAGLTLSISGNSCAINGTPTTPSNSTNYIIRGSNITGSDTATINITVEELPAPNIANVGRTSITTGTEISPITFTNTGGAPSSCTSSLTLPSGLSSGVSGNHCVITGNAQSVTSAQTYTITASNTTGNSAATIRLSTHATGDLVDNQWHLHNTGQTNFASSGGVSDADINIQGVTYTGSGIIVAVVDQGLEIAHEDLSENVVPGGSKDFVDGDTDPTTREVDGDHGTSVAGIIAALDNSIGPKGVAPNVSLKGFNLLETGAGSYENEENSLGGGSYAQDVSIFNQSYGRVIPALSNLNYRINSFTEGQLIDGVTNLRSGKGAIYVKSAGNDYYRDTYNDITYRCSNTYSSRPDVTCGNANMDKKNSSPYVIVVGATNAEDVKSSYSSAGSNIWVSAPGGEYGFSAPAILTTDQSGCEKGYSPNGSKRNYNSFETNANSQNPECNYTSTFNGTSSAAPVVSGVIALMLEANPELTWRDVKHILANTSEQIDANIGNVTTTINGVTYNAEPAWLTNAAGYTFHNWYGFGRVDAARAVASATSYINGSLGTFANTGYVSSTPNSSIPDFNVIGSESSITISSTPNLTIETIQIDTTITHPDIGELAIELTSPSGTQSVLLNMTSMYGTLSNTANLGTELLSNAFYGETANGNWTLKVIDTISGNSGTLNSWSLKIYGH